MSDLDRKAGGVAPELQERIYVAFLSVRGAEDPPSVEQLRGVLEDALAFEQGPGGGSWGAIDVSVISERELRVIIRTISKETVVEVLRDDGVRSAFKEALANDEWPFDDDPPDPL